MFKGTMGVKRDNGSKESLNEKRNNGSEEGRW
jgi:hypothetical protein